jgi:hypothetical protein
MPNAEAGQASQAEHGAGLWPSRRQKVGAVHNWRPRRSSFDELVQCDTSDHDWLEERGERLYLIHLIDDTTSELVARFVRSDSTAENMQVLRQYLERNGRPLAFYTDKASAITSRMLLYFSVLAFRSASEFP